MPSDPNLQAPQTRLMSRFEALARSTRVAVVDARGASTFDAVSERVRNLARELGAAQLRGRRVALLADPDREWLEGFWAILWARATPVPLSSLHPAPEQEAFLAQSQAAALLVSESAASRCEARHPLRLVFGEGRLVSENGASRAPRSESGQLEREREAENATALLLHTSGTTGRPKGVPLSHGNVFAGIECLIDAWAMTQQDRLVHCLPLHHLHGICVSLLCAYCAGASTQFVPRYDPEQVVSAATGSSVLMGVPTQHKRLVDYLEGLDAGGQAACARVLRSLRLITSGSAKLPERVGHRLADFSGQYPLERYGMTEVGIVLGNPLLGTRQPGSCGKPLPGCDIRIVDESGRDAEGTAAGEIWIRGDSVFAGYDADPGATAEAFEAGFFKSGDTAVWTPEGFVRILGRTSVDIIKSGGYKLSALEIEEHLRSHVSVQDVAVVGVADETWGERVVAVVVPSAVGQRALLDPAAASRELQQWMKERVAGYQVPKAFVWQADLPRNSMGKVQKTELIRALGAASPSTPSSKGPTR